MAYLKSANLIEIGDDYGSTYPVESPYGDCAIVAMSVVTDAAGLNIGYNRIADDVIKIKQDNWDIYQSSHPKIWFESHGAVPTEITTALLEQYFGKPLSQTIVLTRHTRGKLTAALANIPFALILSHQHITAIKSGAVYDRWDSRRKIVEEIISLPEHKTDVRRIVKNAISTVKRNPTPDWMEGKLEPNERDLFTKELRLIKDNPVYSIVIQSLNKVFERSLIKESTLKLVVKQELEEDPNFVWAEDLNTLLTKEISNLERKGIIRILSPPPEFSNDDSILGTVTGCRILNRLANALG